VTAPGPERGSCSSTPLGVLGRRLRDARVRVHQHRTGAAGSTQALGARLSMLAALTDYIAALEDRGIPVPYVLRDELRLHRLLYAPEEPSVRPGR
jgi:hypothetical protein